MMNASTTAIHPIVNVSSIQSTAIRTKRYDAAMRVPTTTGAALPVTGTSRNL
jgi:hypothetical protein